MAVVTAPLASSRSSGTALLALAIGLFLVAFLVVPVATVVYVAFTEKGGGAFTLINFLDFVRTELFVRSFWNSVYVSAMTVLWSSAFALPLAYLTTRFEFRGAMLVHTLGFLPLIMPPFVGAVAMQLLFGRNGTVNLLLDEYFDFKIGFMEGLNGVIFLQAIHYFPFILVNLSAALRNIDRSMEEAAQNLGSHGLRLFRRIALPLALPGYVAGASLVFVKVFDDVASPLLLNVKEMLAPQAYLRITSIGIVSIVMSLLLAVAELIGSRRRKLDTVRPVDGILVGLAQTMAIVPGVSRSGSTLTASLFDGWQRASAARFSFLLGIPAISLAGLVELKDAFSTPLQGGWIPLLLGVVVATIVSWLAIAWLLRFLREHTTWIFVGYRLLFGLALLIWFRQLDAPLP